MKTALLSAIAAAVLVALPASAYSLRNTANGGPCVADGSACEVLCDNGTLAGTMYGTKRLDGRYEIRPG